MGQLRTPWPYTLILCIGVRASSGHHVVGFLVIMGSFVSGFGCMIADIPPGPAKVRPHYEHDADSGDRYMFFQMCLTDFIS